MQLRFVTSESASDYFRPTRAYLEEHSKPVAFYSDKHGIFRVNSKDAAGGEGVTQLGRALLAPEHRHRLGQQPAGRGAHRPSTSSGARLARCRTRWSRACPGESGGAEAGGVSSIAAGNAWLPGFITGYNRRFGPDPANAKRCNGVSGERRHHRRCKQPTGCPMPQLNDLSRSPSTTRTWSTGCCSRRPPRPCA